MGKKLLLLLMIASQAAIIHAQANAIDSLGLLLQTEKQDTSRVLLLNQLSRLYLRSSADTAAVFARQGLVLAKKIGFAKGEAIALTRMGNVFHFRGNYPKALELHLEGFKKAEAAGDEKTIEVTLSNIAIDYNALGNYRSTVDYSFKALAIARHLDDKNGIITCLGNLGDSYEKLNILDSARLYTIQAYDIAEQLNNTNRVAIILNNLGNIYSKMGQDAVAMANYNLCVPYYLEENNQDGLCEAYLGMAKLFLKNKKADSALYYAKLSLDFANRSGFIPRVMNASNFLTDYYSSVHDTDSTLVYLKATIAAKDSLFNQEKSRQIQSLIFDETMRQQKIEEEKEAVQEERHRNIQYAIIAIGVVTFLILFLVYSRTIVANEKAIRFLGILALLLVFELINLFIHPYIGNLTHETPILQLLIAVAIASLLIPLHHKLQHMLTHQMVIKNKRIKLAAAEKIVAKLKKDKDLNAQKE